MPDETGPSVPNLAAAGIGVVTAAVAIYSGYTGTLARLSRNDPWVIPVALGFAFLAVAAAFAAGKLPAHWGDDGKRSTLEKDKRRANWSLWLVIAAVGITALTGILITSRISASLATADRPRITAKWVTNDDETTLSATVSAQGLKSADKMTITAVRLLNNGEIVPSTPPTPGPSYTPSIRPHLMTWGGIVYQQFVGPDIDGNVSVPLEIPLPPGYSGILIVASNSEANGECPVPPTSPPGEKKVEAPDYACVWIDAPWTVPSASPQNTAAAKGKEEGR